MKKRGFTLIELLAVIVILAIIALIATPIILNMINNAKKSAAVDSAYGYIEAIETNIALARMNEDNNILEDGIYTDINDFSEIKVKGSKPTSLNITIENGAVKEAELCFNDYRIEYEDNQAEVNGKCGATEKTIYKETILNGADPVYNSNLIPVTIEVVNGETKVKKADIYSKWYSYKNKRWANAVVLKTNTTYNDNQEIPLSNIESYFVWIPRYSYQIFDLGEYSSATTGTPTTLGSNKKEIQIKFGTNTTSDSNTGECTTPLTAGTKGECTVGKYMTHPAFITMNTNGLWVGKYETGYDGATTKTEAQQNSSDSTKIIIQPNVYSWRNITVKNAFTASYNYLRSNDSHMMKNTEWGAVAYLSHSKYGINIEVNINNNSDYKTGYSAVTVPTCYGDSSCNISGTTSTITQAYNTTVGYKASTTGNITGIYDMSGGAWEYMASYRADTLGSSGFASSDTYMGSAYSKYFDVYPSDSSTTTYSKRILGDATGEIGPFYNYADKDKNAQGNYNTRYHNNWYADFSYFVESSNPWFVRGGHFNDGVLAGQFNFSRSTGGAFSSGGFRIVLNK